MSGSQFRRYTTLPYLLDMLHNKRLTLLDPSRWEDKNDAYFLKTYKKERELKSVLALCFAKASEAYHHWKIYSGNTSGVCIEFDEYKLLRYFEADDYISKTVQYKTIETLEKKPPTIDDLPFTKRYAYAGEQEFRIIYISTTEEIEIKHVIIGLDCINKISINSWIDEVSRKSIEKTIQSIQDCEKIKVIKSTVTENRRWKKIADNAT